MKPLRVIQIGNYHDHAFLNMNALKSHPEVFTVLGVCDIDEERNPDIYEGLERIAFEDALSRTDVDAFIIEAGKENEVRYGIECARHGFPIFMDKPGSADLADFKVLLDIVREKSLPFALGYMFRSNLAMQKAVKMVNDGELGKIYSIEAQMSVWHPKEKREWLKKYKGGMMYFLGCHIIDLMCTVQGFPDEIIPMSCSTGEDGVEADDFGFTVFKYGNNISTVRTTAAEYNSFTRRQFIICGTKGTIEINPLEGYTPEGLLKTGVKSTLAADNPTPWADSATEWNTEPYDRYFPMLEQFARQVREGAPYLRSLDYEYKLMETIVRACGCKNSVTDEA